MKRETVNIIRFVLEELLPPIVRDSVPARWLFRFYWGPLIDQLEEARAKAPFLTDQEYAAMYEDYPRIQDETDNSEACLKAIASQVTPGKICDIGCGTGYLLKYISDTCGDQDLSRTGVDFIIDEETRSAQPNVTFEEAKIEQLPFDDGHFDTVICTHVLEHVLDIRQAIGELRRICKKRLILVVPQEREYRFTFNPHFHFFPYPHSFLRYIIPIPKTYECRLIGRDIFYWEDVGS